VTRIYKASIEPHPPWWWVLPGALATGAIFISTDLIFAALLGVIAASTYIFLARNSTMVFDQPDATRHDKKRFLLGCALSGILGTPLICALVAYVDAKILPLAPLPPLSFFAFAASFSAVAGLACLIAARKYS
jgi:hypothetical protein